MEIRRATLSDAAAIAHVHVASWRAAYRGIVPDAFLAGFSESEREAKWKAVLSGPCAPFNWICGEGGGGGAERSLNPR